MRTSLFLAFDAKEKIERGWSFMKELNALLSFSSSSHISFLHCIYSSLSSIFRAQKCINCPNFSQKQEKMWSLLAFSIFGNISKFAKPPPFAYYDKKVFIKIFFYFFLTHVKRHKKWIIWLKFWTYLELKI